jgi:serine/threonine protein kinase
VSISTPRSVVRPLGAGYNCAVEIGSVIGGHRIERLVGRGGMGVVYAAVDIALDRPVALKLVAPGLAADPGFRRRFMTESKIAASIDHPNVVPIYAAGEDDGVLFLAMRFVAGDDLRTIVGRDGPLAPERAASVVSQVAAALDAAHSRGLVHRDVKPANVLVTGDDHCYLTDFGLVKDLAATTGATGTGGILGTLDYVAPERIQGGAVGAWTDVYALGCVLFFALTGTVVFPLEAPESKLWAHVSEPPPPVSALCSSIPPALDAVVAQALAKDPADRYASARELAAAVREATSAEDPVADGRLARLLAMSRDDARLGRAVARLIAHARELEERAAELAPERIEHELADVRSRQLPGKAERVDALAQQLLSSRRARARLDAFNAGVDALVVELEAAGDVNGMCDRLEAMVP